MESKQHGWTPTRLAVCLARRFQSSELDNDRSRSDRSRRFEAPSSSYCRISCEASPPTLDPSTAALTIIVSARWLSIGNSTGRGEVNTRSILPSRIDDLQNRSRVKSSEINAMIIFDGLYSFAFAAVIVRRYRLITASATPPDCCCDSFCDKRVR